jgi:hypothetical protein
MHFRSIITAHLPCRNHLQTVVDRCLLNLASIFYRIAFSTRIHTFQIRMDHYVKLEDEKQSGNVYRARLPLGGECRVVVNDGTCTFKYNLGICMIGPHSSCTHPAVRARQHQPNVLAEYGAPNSFICNLITSAQYLH